MSNEPRRADCPECNTPDVEVEPIYSGEMLGECPNCERSFTEYDRGYMVVDSSDNSDEGEAAKDSNRSSGFLW